MKNKAELVNWPTELDIEGLHKSFGSQTWIVCEAQLKENVLAFEHFTSDCGRIYFPVKTNPSLSVLQLLAHLGAGADCASESEVELAIYAGIQVSNISYNTPAQDVALCKKLLQAGAKVVMDDLDSILCLQEALKGQDYSGKLILRINLLDAVGYADVAANQELMSHGHSSSKFGIPIEKVEQIIHKIHLPIEGLHVHVGTQMDNMESFIFAITELNNLADKLNAKGGQIVEINIGGGLGIPFAMDQTFPSLEHWVHSMREHKHPRYNYAVEPGHALIGNAVSYLTEVIAIKESRGKKWAILNVGTDQFAKITLLKWSHRIIDRNGFELKEGNGALAGPLCFAGDTLLDNVSVDTLKIGSPLLITEAGAYTYSMTNRFNGRLASKWVLIRENGEVFKTLDAESSYDNSQLMNYQWNAAPADEEIVTGSIDLHKVNLLSSKYLRQQIEEDRYDFISVSRITANSYRFVAAITSKVPFVSMPLAVRIFGDASIIAILHKHGFASKDFNMWGRKLVLDCFNLIKINQNLNFRISLSEEKRIDGSTSIVVQFKTDCGKCAGSFIGIY